MIGMNNFSAFKKKLSRSSINLTFITGIRILIKQYSNCNHLILTFKLNNKYYYILLYNSIFSYLFLYLVLHIKWICEIDHLFHMQNPNILFWIFYVFLHIILQIYVHLHFLWMHKYPQSSRYRIKYPGIRGNIDRWQTKRN